MSRGRHYGHGPEGARSPGKTSCRNNQRRRGHMAAPISVFRRQNRAVLSMFFVSSAIGIDEELS